MRAWTLGSGSKGNAILLESGGTRVLIDAGFSPRELARRLAGIGIAPESIEAVVVTHEHTDHVRGVSSAQRRWRWQLFGSAGTISAIADLDAGRSTAVRPRAPFRVGALQFELVPVPHDASAPTAVVVTATRSGFRTGVAHDLGAVPDELRSAFERVDLLMLESNHDQEMLRTGPYPAFLQARISGGSGHLSNAKSSVLSRELSGSQLRRAGAAPPQRSEQHAEARRGRRGVRPARRARNVPRHGGAATRRGGTVR